MKQKIISSLKSAFGTSEKQNHKVFPPSPQSDLFAYLKPEQQEMLRTILRLVKRPYQTELCMALLDYLEGFGIQPIANPMLHLMQYTIIEACHLVPLRITGRLANHYEE